MAQVLLLDDFTRSDGLSALGTRWQGFTDRVMGGRSDMEVRRDDSEAGAVLRMRGTVRLENRGGFIQARLPLAADDQVLDATAWQGIRLKARGRPGPWYLHLRSRHCRLPWQHYRARLKVNEDWRAPFVAFDDFAGKATWRGLDTSVLKSVAVVAYGEAFEAEIEVARIELVSLAAAATGKRG